MMTIILGDISISNDGDGLMFKNNGVSAAHHYVMVKFEQRHKKSHSKFLHLFAAHRS